MIRMKPIVTIEADIHLNEVEIMALDALAGYGFDAFIEVFYTHLGKAYMEPYEEGLKGFFEKVRKTCAPAIQHVNDMRKVLGEKVNPK